MSKISKQIAEIEVESTYRIMEINYMFSQLSSFDNGILDNNGSIDNNSIGNDTPRSINILDKYFLARSIVVFSYATLEKFIKSLSQHALTAILDNNFFQNNVKELMSILKYGNSPSDIFDLIMHYKNEASVEYNFEYILDKGYFGRRSRVDGQTIAHICNVFDLNKSEPLLKIPAHTINSISENRMNLAHGDYISELKRFNSSRDNIKIEDINDYIENTFKLNNTTKNDLLQFITDFKEKIIGLLTEIDDYNNITRGA